ncbi:MAG TPA: sigma-70 family RNA polymerase sigma factor [Bacteroidota bacterium]|nr:sigma-70 family RNA polymerase sigma factor [Bacteroidota bacterium]
MAGISDVPGDDARIIQLLRNGNEEVLLELYRSHRAMILAYVTHNSGTADDADDLLQEAVIVLWERVRDGSFEYRSKLSTFLYGVVKNLWSRRLARKRRERPADPDPDAIAGEDPDALETIVRSEEIEAVQNAMRKLSEQCRKLLLLFYWEMKPMEEIATLMGFANADTAKSKKYQCKKSLESLLSGSEQSRRTR